MGRACVRRIESSGRTIEGEESEPAHTKTRHRRREGASDGSFEIGRVDDANELEVEAEGALLAGHLLGLRRRDRGRRDEEAPLATHPHADQRLIPDGNIVFAEGEGEGLDAAGRAHCGGEVTEEGEWGSARARHRRKARAGGVRTCRAR